MPTNRKKKNGYFGDIDPPNHRMMSLKDGTLDVAELDDDEVAYGITKCDDGKFSAKAAYHAARLPASVKKKLQAELVRRAENSLRGNLLNAINSIVEIATSDLSDDKDKFRAATYLLERVQGKTPDVVQVSQEKPWEMVLSAVEAGTRAESRERREVESERADDEGP